MDDGGSSVVEWGEYSETVPANELLFVYVPGGGPEPLVIWPGQVGLDIVEVGGHSSRDAPSVYRVRLESGLLARLRALNDTMGGELADVLAAVHAAGMVHATRPGSVGRR